MLVLSDYYQVTPIKQECEALLQKLPVTLPRLIQAHKHSLSEQYERCAREVARTLHDQDLEVLRTCGVDVLMDVLAKVQRSLADHEALLEAERAKRMSLEARLRHLPDKLF